jgi:hypothetical protein
VHVKTGDKFGAGTNSNIHLQIENQNGVLTPKKKLDKWFHDDHERGKLDSYDIDMPDDFLDNPHVKSLRLTRDTSGLGDAWYLEHIQVNCQ